jgi:hypothetical protein
MSLLLPPFQIIRRFGFSRYIVFTMYLDIVYIKVHSKSYVSKKTKHLIIWNRGSTSQYADIFTRGLPSSVFLEFRSSLGICSILVLIAGEC